MSAGAALGFSQNTPSSTVLVRNCFRSSRDPGLCNSSFLCNLFSLMHQGWLFYCLNQQIKAGGIKRNTCLCWFLSWQVSHQDISLSGTTSVSTLSSDQCESKQGCSVFCPTQLH